MKKKRQAKGKYLPAVIVPPPAAPPPTPPPMPLGEVPVRERCVFLINDLPAIKFFVAWSFVQPEYIGDTAGKTDAELWQVLDPEHVHRVARHAGLRHDRTGDLVRKLKDVGLIRPTGTVDTDALQFIRLNLNSYEKTFEA